MNVRERNESAWLLPNDGTRTPHKLRDDMRRFDDNDEVDVAIVGCGAGGSTLLQRLARAGWKAVAFDAGPFWDPDRDWVSDELGSHHLYWTEPRVLTGADPVPLGWEAHPVGLEELALAYLREPGAAALPGPARRCDAEPAGVTT